MSTHAIPSPVQQDAFESWWQREGEWVEPPNQRRGGESGVKRIDDPKLGLLYLKRQVGHLYRNLLHPFGRPTALREKAALLALTDLGVKVPELVYCEARRRGGWRALLVTRALTGYVNVNAWYEQGGREQFKDCHDAMLQKLGAMLARMHARRWQHACLYWKHLFISTRAEADGLPGVAMVDLEKARRRFTSTDAARRDLDQLRRHSDVWGEQEWEQVLQGHGGVFGRRVFGPK